MSLLTRLFSRGQEGAVPDGSDIAIESPSPDGTNDEPTNVDDEVSTVDTGLSSGAPDSDELAEPTEEQQPPTAPSVPRAIARHEQRDTDRIECTPPPPLPPTPTARPATTLGHASPRPGNGARPAPRVGVPAPPRVSTRRGAAPAPPRSDTLREADTESDNAEDLDDAFERLLTPVEGLTVGGPEPEPAIDSGDEARRLFEEIATHHAEQIRNFMLEVRVGAAPTEWLEMCEAVVSSLTSASAQLEMGPLGDALAGFSQAVAAARAGAGSTLDAAASEKLMSAYAPLVEAMPEAFELDAERNRREPIIVRSLLLQVEGVHEVAVRKIYAAGLTGLDAILGARAGDLADAAGIPLAMAQRVVDRFRAYKADATTAVAAQSTEQERETLSSLVDKLRAYHEDLEDAANGWSDDHLHRKRVARAARGHAMLEVRVALARLGEVDLADEIEKMPFQRRIEKLVSFLAG